MLALPAGLAAGSGTGYFPAYLLLAFSAISSAYTFILVGRAVEATKARNFKEVSQASFLFSCRHYAYKVHVA